ncbi:hypothetical protein [Cytobacillus oceanisediminis]|uniref:hypothetical protein n=1 Tax=Cytobacillus oceanisediminis TaxID=665099 RepID=UPI001FB51184|nr:hypothetical protein [Cytobacillus oceanisediminis]UOE57611.1 hypothetical protein IRB79_13065 [Cytobacillus oceanisediminis]
MKKEQEKAFGLSYESDGEMGEKTKNNNKDNKEQDDMFLILHRIVNKLNGFEKMVAYKYIM